MDVVIAVLGSFAPHDATATAAAHAFRRSQPRMAA
jgi:hypothetical protein